MNGKTELQYLQRTLTGFQDSCVLVAATELGFFRVLSENPRGFTASRIAEETKCDLRGTTVILDALCAQGFLEKAAERAFGADLAEIPSAHDEYRIIEEYGDYFDEAHPKTYIPMILHQGNCLRQWSQLSWTAKTGFPAPEHASLRGPEADTEAFILAMNSVARTVVEPLVQKMEQAGIFPFEHLLDVGSGPGTYSIAMLQAVPNAKATLYDLPSGLQIAKRRLTEAALDSRARFVEGNFYRDESLPQGADFAWISAIIHQHGRRESRDLYRKVFAALVGGGRIAVRDFMMNEDRTAPKAGTFFGVNMLANTVSGRVYTYEEVREDLESVGFTEVRLAISSEDMSSLVLAEKP